MLLAIAMLVHVAIGRLYVHGCTDHGPPGTRPEEANGSLINGHFRDLKRRYLPFLGGIWAQFPGISPHNMAKNVQQLHFGIPKYTPN